MGCQTSENGCPGRQAGGSLGRVSGLEMLAAGSFLFSSSRVEEEITAFAFGVT